MEGLTQNHGTFWAKIIIMQHNYNQRFSITGCIWTSEHQGLIGLSPCLALTSTPSLWLLWWLRWERYINYHKESACNAADQGSGRSPGEDPFWLLTPVFFPREFHGQRSPVGYSLWGHKESDMNEWLRVSHYPFWM